MSLTTKYTSLPGPTADGITATGASAVPSRFSARRLLLVAGPAALAGSLVAVLAIRSVAVSSATSTGRFPPLAPANEVSLTVIGVLLAGGACLVLNHRSPHPLQSFRPVAAVALLVSFVPDLALWVTRFYPQTRAGTVLPLMAMHLAVATICFVALPLLGRE